MMTDNDQKTDTHASFDELADVNSKWRESKLGDEINLKRGYDLAAKIRQPGTVPIFSSGGVSGFHDVSMCSGPGVIAGRYGTIGKIFYAKTPYWPLNTTLYVQDFKGNDSLYVYYFLQQLDWEKYSDKSAVPGVNRNDVHQEDVLFPPLPEQKAIAAILSSLDAKIDLLQRQIKTLEAMAETLFRQWFVAESELPPVKQFELGDLVDSISVSHKFPSKDVIFLNTSDIYHGEVLAPPPVDIATLPGQAKKTIQNGDILFSEIRPANGRYAYISFNAENFVVSTKLMVLRSRNVVNQAFIYFYLTNSMTMEWLQLLAESRSGTFPQITFEQLRDLNVNIPTPDILDDVVQWCETTLKKIVSNYAKVKTLEKLRDDLLPKLISGEIRVNY